jgi:hypothetical protein
MEQSRYKFRIFCGTRRFITMFKTALQPVPILSKMNPVHTFPPISFRSVLILSSYFQGFLAFSKPTAAITPAISQMGTIY